tara:strand:- start:240 stop:620 length:381 start_codon:yes stop_codon:yes gene_type:complete
VSKYIENYLASKREEQRKAEETQPDKINDGPQKRRRGRYRRAEDRPDTAPALRALMVRLSGEPPSLRGCARILGTGHSALHGYLNGTRGTPTLDTISAFIDSAHTETGLVMNVTFGPDRQVRWSFE